MPTRKSGKYALTVLGAVLLLSLACRALLPTPPAPPPGEAARTPTIISQPTTLPTQTLTPRPPEPTSAPTVTIAHPAPACPLSVSPGMLEAASFQDYPQAILEYLNLGVTPQALAAELARLDIANRPSAVLQDDITGNGQVDLAVSIFDPTSQQILPAGMLLVYTCQAGEYVLSYQQPTPESIGGPRLWYLEDLNADGSAELAFSFISCGAHTCFEQVELLSWEGETMVSKMDIDTSSLPNPQISLLDPNADGIFQLEISGTGFGSVGAGPQRAQIMYIEYDPVSGRWILTGTALGASNYRIHILRDADRALRSGDYPTARQLYERVIADPTLEDWLDPQAERTNLAAYAGYKLVVIAAMQGDLEIARQQTEALQDTTSVPPPSSYAELAQIFLDTYQASDMHSACQAVKQYAEKHTEAVLSPINAFGYGNPAYIAEDLCP